MENNINKAPPVLNEPPLEFKCGDIVSRIDQNPLPNGKSLGVVRDSFYIEGLEEVSLCNTRPANLVPAKDLVPVYPAEGSAIGTSGFEPLADRVSRIERLLRQFQKIKG